MPVLQPSEYDASYFDGNSQPLRHNAGYSKYKRWYRNEGENSLGEFWKDKAAHWANHLVLAGKSVLDVGCAKGFLVEDLVDMGVDAYGIDVSSYAIETAEDSAKLRRPDLADRFYVGDVRTALSQFSRNQFDVLLSFRFLECIDETDLANLIDDMNRISKLQIHVIDEQANDLYYIKQPISWWVSHGFSKNSRIISNETRQELIK